MIFLFEGSFDFLSEDALVKQVLDTDADPIDFVGVGGTNSSSGRANLALAQKPLGDLVECSVIEGHHVSVGAHHQLRHIKPPGHQSVEFFSQDIEVHHHPVADYRRHTGGQNSTGKQVQGIFLVTDDDRVTGVVAAIELHDVVDPLAE